MPPTLSYPGVYIEELPSGVHPITGVATSITAFIGRALRGPVDEAITITSFADFGRIYGGVWLESNLGYAVQDFYRNGGSIAIIVRVHKTKAERHRVAHARQRHRGRSRLQAASPGAWGSKLTAVIDDDVGDPSDTTRVQPHRHRHAAPGRSSSSGTCRSRPAARGASISCS